MVIELCLGLLRNSKQTSVPGILKWKLPIGIQFVFISYEMIENNGVFMDDSLCYQAFKFLSVTRLDIIFFFVSKVHSIKQSDLKFLLETLDKPSCIIQRTSPYRSKTLINSNNHKAIISHFYTCHQILVMRFPTVKKLIGTVYNTGNFIDRKSTRL